MMADPGIYSKKINNCKKTNQTLKHQESYSINPNKYNFEKLKKGDKVNLMFKGTSYPANVIGLDPDEKRVKVHFVNFSSKKDDWFSVGKMNVKFAKFVFGGF